MHIVSPLSTEYLRVPVSSTEAGASVDPTVDVVQMAVVATGSTPTGPDWKNATWETDATTDPDTYYARVLIGPAPGVQTLTAGQIYDVYVKVTDNPELPVRNAGAVAAL